MLLLFVFTTLSGVISMYLVDESPSVIADLVEEVPVINMMDYLRMERALDNKKDAITSTLNSQTQPSVLKRNGLGGRSSLSIVNPLDVLREKLLLQIQRKRQREQIDRNREYLKKIG